MYRHVHVCVAMYVWVHARMYAMACKGVCVSVIVSKRNEDEQEKKNARNSVAGVLIQ